MIFICPICKQKLELFENKTVKCPSGHSFDRAKEEIIFVMEIGNRGDIYK